MASEKNTGLNPTAKVLRRIVLALVIIMLILVSIYAYPTFVGRLRPTTPTTLQALATPSPTSTLFHNILATSPPMAPVLTLLPPTPASFDPTSPGLAVLSIGENGSSNLFAYQPGVTPLIRLTSGSWQDITPAVSPDGARIAFASNRNGYYDLYLMELDSGKITQLTDTPAYDAAPSWSPDGLWIVYESYFETLGGGDLEIFILPIQDNPEALRLTDHPGADHSPAWSPSGRTIAFVSTREGESDIWLAYLDQVKDRFHNISKGRYSTEAYPAWSPDGGKLSFSSRTIEGVQKLFIWDATHPGDQPRQIGEGERAAWNPQGTALLCSLATPNQDYLTGYSTSDLSLVLPPVKMPGKLTGISWGNASLPDSLPTEIRSAAELTPTPLWSQVTILGTSIPGGRQQIVNLKDIDAPMAKLQDRVDEAFYALRERVAAEAGWDFLANLEETFIALTSPLEPGMYENWLFTGRAFRFSTSPVDAGWMKVTREDYGSLTYWRVFLKTRFQDGSQGIPLHSQIWNFTARHSGDPLAYERGGALEVDIPPGYWIDFTQLAVAYGWERQPALSTWRIAYSAARFNELVHTGGLDWLYAMLEVYPRAAIDTATPVPSPTSTPTNTMTPTVTPTPTRTPYLSPTPTLSPTPRPSMTPRPTSTPWPTATSKYPSATPTVITPQ